MKNHSFFFHLIAGSLVIVGSVLLVLCFVAYVHLDRNYRTQQLQWQSGSLLTVRESIDVDIIGESSEVDAKCKYLGKLLGSEDNRITVIAPSGQVLGDSVVENIATMEPHHRRREVAAAIKGLIGSDTRRSETTGREYSYMAAPLYGKGQSREDSNNIVAIVRLAIPIKTLVEGRRAIMSALSWAAMLAALVSVGLAMLVGKLWSRPLERITEVARKLAGGDLQARAALTGSRELETLATALNDMREGLSEKIQTIDDQRENLRTVLTNLRDGVIAMDQQRNIAYINDSAVKLLDLEQGQFLGRHVQAVVREPGILDLLRDLDDGKPAGEQIRIHHGDVRRTLDVHAVDVHSGGPAGIKTLLVFNDITEIDRMATIKADFVANASHELRTPLATLRVAVDSFMDTAGDQGPNTRIASILDRQLKRLEAMTGDLLDLHWVEQADGRTLEDEIVVSELLAQLRERFAESLEKGSLELAEGTIDAPESFYSDQRMIMLILNNLLENAIKFTPAGGRVGINFQRSDDGKKLDLSVWDSGPGISPDARTRIFERFYQADQVRSGDSVKRGTGLGLAIVKYSCERIGAAISVDCPPSGGTVFTLKIPLDGERPE